MDEVTFQEGLAVVTFIHPSGNLILLLFLRLNTLFNIVHQEVAQSHCKVVLNIQFLVDHADDFILQILEVFQFLLNRIQLFYVEVKYALQEEARVISK